MQSGPLEERIKGQCRRASYLDTLDESLHLGHGQESHDVMFSFQRIIVLAAKYPISARVVSSALQQGLSAWHVWEKEAPPNENGLWRDFEQRRAGTWNQPVSGSSVGIRGPLHHGIFLPFFPSLFFSVLTYVSPGTRNPGPVVSSLLFEGFDRCTGLGLFQRVVIMTKYVSMATRPGTLVSSLPGILLHTTFIFSSLPCLFVSLYRVSTTHVVCTVEQGVLRSVLYNKPILFFTWLVLPTGT